DNAKSEAISSSNDYTDYWFNQLDGKTDSRFNQVNNRIDKLENKVNAGLAGVTAIASIPYVQEDRFSFGMGLGNYSNGNAIAAGAQYKPTVNTNVRLNFSWDNESNSAIGAGFAVGF
uniref:YadA-like family protein n=1 Tax=Proteus mirabilis TaxID=584 RepID=UPI0034D52855